METISHLLYECIHVKPIWGKINSMLTYCELENIDDIQHVILNNVGNTKHVMNEIVLLTKQLIYRKRCEGKKITIANVIGEYSSEYYIQMFSGKRNGRESQVAKRWNPIVNFVK